MASLRCLKRDLVKNKNKQLVAAVKQEASEQNSMTPFYANFSIINPPQQTNEYANLTNNFLNQTHHNDNRFNLISENNNHKSTSWSTKSK